MRLQLHLKRSRVTPHRSRADFGLNSRVDDNRRFQKEIKSMKSSTQDKVEGTAKNIAGHVKETTGKAVGNPRLQAAGRAEKVEGQIQKKIGDIKQALGS
jgi:uncharacterized protein YjbJ (UPF0337 family)